MRASLVAVTFWLGPESHDALYPDAVGAVSVGNHPVIARQRPVVAEQIAENP
jgi:hypothetical protein